MRGLIIQTNGEKKIVEFTRETEYETLRQAVGGYIEVVYLNNLLMWVNEEGKIHNLPPNPIATLMMLEKGIRDIIAGDVIITGPADSEGYCTGIPDCFSL